MRYLSVYIFFSVLVCGAVLARPVWAGPVRLNMEKQGVNRYLHARQGVGSR
jgi:hypothetical protein